MIQQHTITRFDEELIQLKARIVSMGGMVERAISDSVKSILEQDNKLAQLTIDRDREINDMEVACDNMTRAILVRRQLASGDLRFIVAMIKVVTDLERMGDLAAHIAKGTILVCEHPPKHYSSLGVLGEKVLLQVGNSLDALSHDNIDLAMDVVKKDQVIDDLYQGIYREMLTYMLEDPRNISTSITLDNAAKSLERIADHATNVAEMVIYTIRGHDIRHIGHEEAAKLLNT